MFSDETNELTAALEGMDSGISSPLLSSGKHGLSKKKREEHMDDMEEGLLGVEAPSTKGDATKSLIISFMLMVVVGLGNKIFQKLQTLPMYNYANFLNLLTTFFYIPTSFLYIGAVVKWGTAITPQQRAVPMKNFVVMGALDSICGIMQIFAATYLEGSILILLTQSAIPISMIISRYLLKQKYVAAQYLGAIVVALGIALVLVPRLGGQGDAHASTSSLLLWASVMILSCVPMTLSSVYKEKALGDTELDPIYLNGWIAFWQFLFALPIAVPAAMVSEPPVYPADLPRNLQDGLLCFSGVDSVLPNSTATAAGFRADDCAMAPVFVTTYLLFNVSYNILIILILKYGSANVLWLAMTIMVPLGSLAFSLDFVPGHKPAMATDVLGLCVILGGLLTYRFGNTILQKCRSGRGGTSVGS